MASTNRISRSLHDLGLAAWFGGTLMGAVGVNEASSPSAPAESRGTVASTAWAAWTPVNAVAIGAHLVGATLLTTGNKGRLFGQRGVGRLATTKLVLTGAALAATGYARKLGNEVDRHHREATGGATRPGERTPPELAAAQRKLRALEWAIPALTGSMIVVGALMGEQQRPTQVLSGLLHIDGGRHRVRELLG